MGKPRSSSDPFTGLPEELRQRILSQLSSADLALGWRLTCKDAAQRYSEAHHRTARVGQPLPPHAATATWCVEGALDALRQLTFKQKVVRVLHAAASSGCEANVEVAWGALQHILFPELLPTTFYDSLLKEAGVGPAALASGLGPMLPSLQQRCPGLLDPAATLEAAARHCDLAGLQTAWEVLGQRLQSSLQPSKDESYMESMQPWRQRAQGVWRPILAAAAGSATADAVAKLGWVLERKREGEMDYGDWQFGLSETRYPEVPLDREDVCGAAAASGDLVRLQWLLERGFPWGTAAVLRAVLQQADMGCITRVEEAGGYLPPEGDAAWSGRAVMCAAAAAPRDSAAKLRWLAGKGVRLVREVAVTAAAKAGNLEALQLLLEHQRTGIPNRPAPRLPLNSHLAAAVESGSVPTAAWVNKASCSITNFSQQAVLSVIHRGDLPMLKWLLGAGLTHRDLTIASVVNRWPSSTYQDGERLVEAVRLLAAAGWPPQLRGSMVQGEWSALYAAARARHPWPVWRAVLELLPVEICRAVAECAGTAGCEETLEALEERGVCHKYSACLLKAWYASAAGEGDLGTLCCLLRLDVELDRQVLGAAVKEGASLCALKWLVEQGAPLEPYELGCARRYLQLCWPRGGGRKARDEVEAWLRGLEDMADDEGEPSPSADQ